MKLQTIKKPIYSLVNGDKFIGPNNLHWMIIESMPPDNWKNNHTQVGDKISVFTIIAVHKDLKSKFYFHGGKLVEVVTMKFIKPT